MRKHEAKRSPRRQRPAASTPAGREILAGVAEIRAAILSGNPHRGMTVREVEIADPTNYDGRAVRALRHRLGVSTALFARLVGVSPKLVEHWEQGRRNPAPVARRLLDHIKANPSEYLSKLVTTRRAS